MYDPLWIHIIRFHICYGGASTKLIQNQINKCIDILYDEVL
jgi:hypothetical protein